METLRMGSDSEFFDSYNNTTILDIRELVQAMSRLYFEMINRDESTYDALHDLMEKYAHDFTVAIAEDERFKPCGLAFMLASLNLTLSLFYTVVGHIEGAEIEFDAAVMGGELDDEH